jgi:hypothetical protein
MIFDEQKAIEIVRKFGYSKSTINVWRFHAKIPDKYSEDFERIEKMKGEKDQYFLDIKRILKYKKINILSLGRLVGINQSRWADIIYKDIIPTKDEYIVIKNAIGMFRFEASEILSLFNQERDSEMVFIKMKAFLYRDEIRCIPFFGRAIGQKLLDWKSGRRNRFPIKREHEILKAFSVFITETTML